jgi:hypothetical protein
MTRQRASLMPSHLNTARRFAVRLETGHTLPAADQYGPTSAGMVHPTGSTLGNGGSFREVAMIAGGVLGTNHCQGLSVLWTAVWDRRRGSRMR